MSLHSPSSNTSSSRDSPKDDDPYALSITIPLMCCWILALRSDADSAMPYHQRLSHFELAPEPVPEFESEPAALELEPSCDPDLELDLESEPELSSAPHKQFQGTSHMHSVRRYPLHCRPSLVLVCLVGLDHLRKQYWHCQCHGRCRCRPGHPTYTESCA
jgi:hypothetical protein